MHGLPTLYLTHAYDNTRNIPLPDGASVSKNTSLTFTIKNTSDATVTALVSTTVKLKKCVTNPCTKKIAAYNTRTFSFTPIEDCTLNDFVMTIVGEVRESLNSRKRDREETDLSHEQQEAGVIKKCSDSKVPVRSNEEKGKENEGVRLSFARRRLDALRNRSSALSYNATEELSFGKRRYSGLRNPTSAIENEESEKEKKVPKLSHEASLVPRLIHSFNQFGSEIGQGMEVNGEPVEAYGEPIRSKRISNEGRSHFYVLISFLDIQTRLPIPHGRALISGREVGVEIRNPLDSAVKANCFLKRLDGIRAYPQFNTITTIPKNTACKLFNFTPKKEDGTLILDCVVVSLINPNASFNSKLFFNVQ